MSEPIASPRHEESLEYFVSWLANDLHIDASCVSKVVEELQRSYATSCDVLLLLKDRALLDGFLNQLVVSLKPYLGDRQDESFLKDGITRTFSIEDFANSRAASNASEAARPELDSSVAMRCTIESEPPKKRIREEVAEESELQENEWLSRQGACIRACIKSMERSTNTRTNRGQTCQRIFYKYTCHCGQTMHSTRGFTAHVLKSHSDEFVEAAARTEIEASQLALQAARRILLAAQEDAMLQQKQTAETYKGHLSRVQAELERMGSELKRERCASTYFENECGKASREVERLNGSSPGTISFHPNHKRVFSKICKLSLTHTVSPRDILDGP